MTPTLSICIATYKRGHLIDQTLDSIVGQLTAATELLIVDGASPDHTEQVVRPYTERHANVRYVREPVNSGVDRDYDKAVLHARGTYCWLMTDDDLLVPDAVRQVLDVLVREPDLAIVNAQVWTADFTAVLKPALLAIDGPTRYDTTQPEQLFADTAAYLSFIGGVVIRRSVWVERQREPYFGSCFVHVGVVFQAPLPVAVEIVRKPLILIRYGNAMWSPRGFEIWMFKWPELIWSFDHISRATKGKISAREPHRSIIKLIWYRAIGGYSSEVYRQLLLHRAGGLRRIVSALVGRLPERIANAGCGLYCWLRPRESGLMAIYEMSRARHAACLTKALARNRGLV